MKALITGVSGFAGRHLTHYLSTQPDVEIYGIDRGATSADSQLPHYQSLDIRDKYQVQDYLNQMRPEAIFHLAAQTHVGVSFQDPWDTLETNIQGTLNILEGLRQLDMKSTRMLIVSSSEIYGYIEPDDLPLKETQLPRPASPYSVSKVTQDMLGLQYYLSYQLDVVRARPFNHIGKGQSPNFVVPNFATQIAEIEYGLKPPILKVGNLSAQRDFSDVRDVVRAYGLIVTQGKAGEVYNICSGKAVSVQYIVDTLIENAKVPIQVEVDPARLRPSDVPVVIGDYTALRKQTGWQPQYTFIETLLTVLDDCRERVRQRLS